MGRISDDHGCLRHRREHPPARSLHPDLAYPRLDFRISLRLLCLVPDIHPAHPQSTQMAESHPE